MNINHETVVILGIIKTVPLLIDVIQMKSIVGDMIKRVLWSFISAILIFVKRSISSKT